MRYRLVIFDFDGTLADSFPWFSRTVNDMAERYRFKRIEPNEVEALRRMDAHALMRHLGVAAWKLPLIARAMRRRKAREIEQTGPFAGIAPMLERLSAAAIEIAVVSSNSEANVRAILGAQAAHLIGHYECGVTLFGKAARFRRVLHRSGTDAGATIAIGDEIRDLEAARAAGIAFGAVTWGYTAPEALVERAPDTVFHRPEDIADRLTASCLTATP